MAKNTGLFFRIENDSSAAVGEADATEVLAQQAELDQGVDEVQSASGDVTDVETGIENALEATGELQSIQGSLQEAVDENEGITPREAEHINVRIERVASLLGVTAQDMGLVFRKESFGGKTGRLAATKYKLEETKAWYKKVWEAIKRGWEMLKEGLKSLWSGLTKNAEMIEKRLKLLQGQIATMKTKNAEKKNSSVKYEAKKFSINGETNLASIEGLVKNAIDSDEWARGVVSIISPSETEKDFHNEVSAAFNKGSLIRKDSNLPKSAEKDAKCVLRLLGGRGITVAPKKETIGGAEFDSISIRVDEIDEKIDDSYDALTLDQLGSLCTQSIALAKSIVSNKKYENDVQNVINANIAYMNSMVKNVESMASKAEKENKDGESEMAELTRLNSTIAIAAVKTVSNVVPKFRFETALAVSRLIAGGVSNYKEKND